MRGISWEAVGQLASQEGLCSMESVICKKYKYQTVPLLYCRIDFDVIGAGRRVEFWSALVLHNMQFKINIVAFRKIITARKTDKWHRPLNYNCTEQRASCNLPSSGRKFKPSQPCSPYPELHEPTLRHPTQFLLSTITTYTFYLKLVPIFFTFKR